MDITAVQKKLAERFGGSVGAVTDGRVEKAIEVDAGKIDKIAELLKGDSALSFECLSNLTAVDYPYKGFIQVVYNLFSYKHRHELTVKVNADRANPVVPTVEKTWPAANWMEREAYDLHGVIFTGHSDLRRILLPDDWIGYPLRKDYVEAPEYHGISTIRESMLDMPGRS